MPPHFKGANSVLLVTSEKEAVETNRSILQSEVGGQAKIEVINQQELANNVISGKNSSFDGVLSISSSSHTTKALAEILLALKPGGIFVLREPIAKEANDGQKVSLRTENQMFLALTLAGFVDITKNSTSATEIEVSSTKPNFEIGASSAIKLPVSKKTRLRKRKRLGHFL